MMRLLNWVLISCSLIFFGWPTVGAGQSSLRSQENTIPKSIRDFVPARKSDFKGNGISYGPYRKGQSPGGQEPTKAQILEDLKLIVGDRWQMIRTYGTEPFAEKVCQIIAEEKLDLKLMLGAWVQTEKDLPDKKQLNQKQIAKAIELANKYPKVVAAVSVGNESQVFWSFHKVEANTLIGYARQVRQNIKQPVTVADDFKFWREDESKAVANEIDFIVTHIYAMWLGQSLEHAVPWTKEQYKSVCDKHPNKVVVIGEAGWATEMADHGEQAKLIKGQPGENEQKLFFDRYIAWLKQEKIPYFYFEAFDEPWKGGEDPREVEKHWGLFKEDRTRKAAIRRGE